MPGIEKFGWNGVLFTPFVDDAEAIRSVKGHNDKNIPKEKFRIANSVDELEDALRGFGVKV